MNPSKVLDQARSIESHLADIRRDIHRHPELGYQEMRTSAIVSDYLKGLGIEVRTGVAKTGVIGYLGKGKPVLMLRADMDALQIQEQNEVNYASQHPGLMHACGHDAHVACLLGAATILVKDPPEGQVRFLFQPSEEGADEEGKHGARRVLEEGYVNDLDAVIGLHVFPGLPTKAIAVREGPVRSSADRFRGLILGQACHGARPQEGLDAIVLSTYVINAIHHIVSRRISTLESSVITIGTINGGTRPNIVSDCVEITGTMRSYSSAVRELLITELERAFCIAKTLGGGYELNIDRGPDPVVNDLKLSEMVRQVGLEMLGAENVLVGEQMMGSEDFSFLTRNAPGCIFGLGSGYPNEPQRIAHSPTFDVNDDALPVGAAMMAATAYRFLGQRV